MVIVPLDGNIFWANVESYIILHWAGNLKMPWQGGFIEQWEGFVKYKLGNEIRFMNNNGEEIEGKDAWKLHSRVITLDPPFAVPGCQPLKYLYLLERGSSLRDRLFKALDALNDKQVSSVAFNGGDDYSEKAIKGTAEIFQDWEKGKMGTGTQVYIKQVSLVCRREYFIRYIPKAEPIITPVFRPAFIPILPEEGSLESRREYIKGVIEGHDEQKLKSFLQSSLFYPAAGQDVTPIMLFKNQISNFIYASYGMKPHEICRFLESVASRIHIYRFPLKSLFGMDWEELIKKHADISKVSSFQVRGGNIFAVSCLEKSDDPRQRKELNIVYIPLEGTIAFRELYLKRGISPRVLTYINPGMDCDQENFPRLLSSSMLESKGGLPEFILADRADLKNPLQMNEKYKCVSSDFFGYESEEDETELQLYHQKG